MNTLLQVYEEIIREGRIATIPRVMERLGRPGTRTASHRALQNRLLALTLSGHQVFTCEIGFDLSRLFGQSVILNLKKANARERRLICFDHYLYLSRLRPVLTKWQLRNVFLFHEAASLVSRGAVGRSPVGEAYLLTMIREARNHGIGFLFADQVPQIQHTVVRGNIGTKCLFRLEDEASVDAFKTALSLSEEQRNLILNLPDRRMLVRRPDIPHPFLTKVPDLF